MSIENLTIITGSPEKAAAKAQAYLDAHPNATVLGTSVTMTRGKPAEDKEAEPADESKAKAKDKPATESKAKAKDEPATEVPVVAITLGRVFA